MKALTIKQPWLWAITDLDKRVENRTWKPPQWIIRKHIALHASKSDAPNGVIDVEEIGDCLVPSSIPRGAIIATARVVGWVSDSGFGVGIGLLSPNSIIENKWFFGPIGWVLEDVQKLIEPVPCSGQLGLWDVPNDLLPKLSARPSNKANIAFRP